MNRQETDGSSTSGPLLAESFFPSSVLSHRLFVPSASVTPDLCLFGSEHFLSASLNVLFASWICAGTFFPWANPDLALIVALQRLPETCRAWGRGGSVTLVQRSRGRSSLFPPLPGSTSRSYPFCHGEVELGKPE